MSVCIPTYKGDAFLGAAIDSVLAQTFENFELIVIDDHSPDGTGELVTRYADSRIRYFRNEHNLGPQGNWNRCLAEARGKYFKLLPQDDLLAPDCLAQQVAVLEQDTEHRIALVFSARRIIGPDGKTLLQRGYARTRQSTVAGAALISRCVRRGTNMIGEPGAVMIRLELTRDIGLFDATNPYIIDLDYWFRLLAHGDAYYIPQPLACFRVLPTSWSVAIGARQTSDFRRFIAKTVTMHPGIHNFDRWSGYVMAAVNTFLRHVFYRFFLK